MAVPQMSADEVLTTTRSVRRRLDLTRPVAPALLEECVRIALQAPTSVNAQTWHFVVVTDDERRGQLAELYRRAWSDYAGGASPDGERPDESRASASARYLASILHRVPIHVVPCIEGRPEGMAQGDMAALYGSIIQAGWSFQLAARARGLGSVWTTYHLDYEAEAAAVLGIPYDDVTQVALIPLAHTIGDEFRPAKRRGLDTVLHWQEW